MPPRRSGIGLFMTVHVPLVHPLYAAKAMATVDHISGGRAGLNIVCGWNPKEFGMFNIPLVEKGYDQAAEWIEDHREASMPRPNPLTSTATTTS